MYLPYVGKKIKKLLTIKEEMKFEVHSYNGLNS